MSARNEESLLDLMGHWNAAQDRCERLRTEIKRGKEYLEQVNQDLAEQRARLEDWPAYERSCGKDPLAHYTHALLVNERIAAFLPAWLERHERTLQAAQSKLEALTRETQRQGMVLAPAYKLSSTQQATQQAA